jgi:opacity protein-like surface antigen
MVRAVACGALALLLVASVVGAADDPEAKAVAAAKSWLALVDAGTYGPSWDAAASMFKSTVTKVDWERMAASARGPFGKLRSRELTSSKAVTSLPGAPDGHYVVIQFKTAFEHKAQAVETVTVVLEKDGIWRVTGYFIR